MKKREFFLGLGLAITVMVLYPAFSNAQAKNDSMSKYSIRITKKTDGKTVTIDTTFETKGQFDVDSWIQKHHVLKDKEMGMEDKDIDIRLRDLTDSVKKHAYAYKFRTPHFQGDWNKFFQDTIIINNDTIIRKLKRRFEDLHFPDGFSWKGQIPFPDFKEFDFKYFPKHDSTFNYKMNPPQGSRSYRYRYSWPDEIEPYLPQEQPDKVTIIKKRHGKKIIIHMHNAAKEKNQSGVIKEEKDYSVKSGDKKSNVRTNRRVYVITSPEDKEQVETRVETSGPKGEKKVIIIEEKKNSDK